MIWALGVVSTSSLDEPFKLVKLGLAQSVRSSDTSSHNVPISTGLEGRAWCAPCVSCFARTGSVDSIREFGAAVSVECVITGHERRCRCCCRGGRTRSHCYYQIQQEEERSFFDFRGWKLWESKMTCHYDERFLGFDLVYESWFNALELCQLMGICSSLRCSSCGRTPPTPIRSAIADSHVRPVYQIADFLLVASVNLSQFQTHPQAMTQPNPKSFMRQRSSSAPRMEEFSVGRQLKYTQQGQEKTVHLFTISRNKPHDFTPVYRLILRE